MAGVYAGAVLAVLYTVTSERLKPNPDHSPRAVGAAKRLRHPASDNLIVVELRCPLTVSRSKGVGHQAGCRDPVGLEWFPPFPKYFFI